MINHMNKNIDTSFYNASLFTSYGLKINKGEFGVNGVYFMSGYRGDYGLNQLLNTLTKL